MASSFHIENFGCRAARADGEAVASLLRAAGLSDAALYVYWGYELGYLGIQFYFLGHKAPPT